MGSDKNKELFLRQVEQILDGVKQDKEKVRLGHGTFGFRVILCM